MALERAVAPGPPETGRLTDDEVAGVRDVMAVVEGSRAAMEAEARSLLSRLPDARLLLEQDDAQRAERARERTRRLLEGLERRDITEYLAMIRQEARDLAARGVQFGTLVVWLSRLIPLLHPALVDRYGSERDRLVRCLNGLHRLTGAVIGAAGAEYTEVRESVLEEEHRRILRELSVPVVPVWEGVLVVPLVGVLDSARAREMTQTLLASVSERRARVVILDVTGVPTVDTQVADHLIRTVKAARLLGARSVLVGIRPAIAQTMVRLGVDLESVHTEADLQSGLLYAFRVLGFRIARDATDG